MPHKELQVFPAGRSPIHPVRVDGEPWFVAKDAADVHEFSDTTDALRGLEDSEKGRQEVSTLGGGQSMTVGSKPSTEETT